MGKTRHTAKNNKTQNQMLSPKSASYFLVLQAHGFCWTFSKYAVVTCHNVSQQSIYISFDGY